MIMRFILGIGLRAIAGAALGAAVGFWSGVQVGEWREASATEAKIEAAIERVVRELQESGYEQAAEAIRAGNRAGRDFDDGGLPDDDPHCRDC